MQRRTDLHARLARSLALHRRLFDAGHEPRNALPWLKPLQAWQARRLERSFATLRADPSRRAATDFFLADVYGDQDFRQRDADIARVVPRMQKVLPAALLETLAGGIALAALSHALDLRVAQALQALAPQPGVLDVALYARAYRQAGHRRLRALQIRLIGEVGQGLADALRMPGVGRLLRLSRLPARAAGLGALQSFLELGFAAFAELDDAEAFIADICVGETRVMQRLFAAEMDPFGFG